MRFVLWSLRILVFLFLHIIPGDPVDQLAGGGLNHCGAYGVTDDLAKTIVEKPVSVPDFHATIHTALSIDPSHELMDGTRPVPLTDGGKPIAALFG